ncbi:MAG: ATP-dependent dethiobiotin synthetase BioD [Kiritimatiellia bacterium]
MLPATSLIIVGTDTDAGKTFVTRAIWERYAPRLRVCKPVGTGYPKDNDVAYAGLAPLLHFSPAISPHLAAELQGTPIRLDTLLQRVREQSPHLIETAGGLLCPLNRERKETNLELVEQLERPVLLVVPNRLGCVNHALLTLAMLRARSIPTLGFVLNRQTVGDPTIQRDNGLTIRDLSGADFLGEFLPGDATLPAPLSALLDERFGLGHGH